MFCPWSIRVRIISEISQLESQTAEVKGQQGEGCQGVERGLFPLVDARADDLQDVPLGVTHCLVMGQRMGM